MLFRQLYIKKPGGYRRRLWIRLRAFRLREMRKSELLFCFGKGVCIHAFPEK